MSNFHIPKKRRKNNAQIQHLQRLITGAITEPEWQTLINSLHARAQNGDVRAARLLIQYRFGSPNVEPPALPVKRIRFIEAHSETLAFETLPGGGKTPVDPVTFERFPGDPPFDEIL